MNITEANDAAVLIRFAQGDQSVTEDDLVRATSRLVDRVHKALYAGPADNSAAVRGTFRKARS